MRLARTVVVALFVMVAAGAGRTEAQGRSQERRDQGKPAVQKTAAPAVATEIEIRILREYFAGQKVKPKPLPPGIAKNLARGKPLPPGIAKTRLPADLVARLTVREGHTWLLEGNVVILVDPVGLIVDVLRDIF